MIFSTEERFKIWLLILFQIYVVFGKVLNFPDFLTYSRILKHPLKLMPRNAFYLIDSQVFF